MITLMREILHADEAEESSGLELADYVESITRRNIVIRKVSNCNLHECEINVRTLFLTYSKHPGWQK